MPAHWLGSQIYFPTGSDMESILDLPFHGSCTSSLRLQENLSSTLNCPMISQVSKHLLLSVLSHTAVIRGLVVLPPSSFSLCSLYTPSLWTRMGSRLFTSQCLIMCAKKMQPSSQENIGSLNWNLHCQSIQRETFNCVYYIKRNVLPGNTNYYFLHCQSTRFSQAIPHFQRVDLAKFKSVHIQGLHLERSM